MEMPEWDIESEESLIWGQENRVYELEGLERLLTRAVGTKAASNPR